MSERNPKTDIVVGIIVVVAHRRARVPAIIVKRTATRNATATTGPYSFSGQSRELPGKFFSTLLRRDNFTLAPVSLPGASQSPEIQRF